MYVCMYANIPSGNPDSEIDHESIGIKIKAYIKFVTINANLK
jgi:hypothetical protein